jgi:REP-associated tyrosine transposase
MAGHRKLVRHDHEPGDLHELTFSCYRRMPLITNDAWRKLLCQSIDRAVESWSYRLVAFVLMPEHVHLLVLPTTKVVKVDRFLSAIKQPHSVRIKEILEENQSPLLERLTVQERPGKTSFRYWQEGPGYDRNLSTERAVLAAIHYIHENPVRRGLTRTAFDWKWSSARWYLSDAGIADPDLPRIHGLPWDFFQSV